MNEFLIYFNLGLSHVLDWNAYDHVLFLIVLVASYTFLEWKKVFWLVTTFTLGHTLALILATFNVVNVNSSYVELLIPITIFVTALYNIFRAGKSNKEGGMSILIVTTLFFGVIHGLGFSSFFMGSVGSGTDKFVWLMEFALGIEAAQAIVVTCVLILALIFQSIFNFSKRDWVLVVSSIVIGLVIPILLANNIF
mgnify:CR=1 FL=1